MAKRPSVAECLDEIRRLRAENERLHRLVKTQRPELKALRGVATAIRDMSFSLPLTLEDMRRQVEDLLVTNDDLPTLDEIRGCLSSGRDRVEAALDAAHLRGE